MGHPQVKLSRTNKKSQHWKRIICFFISLFWGLFLLINTWTESLEQLLNLQSIRFQWVSSPNYRSFFYFYDFTLVHPDYIKIKLGHFVGFAVMDWLLFKVFKKHKYAIVLSLMFAFITEFFQLYFGRDGRFYDLLIDSAGVVSVFFLFKLKQEILK